MRILLIEDNEIDIALLRHALDQNGHEYELEILSNGEAALAFIHEYRTGRRHPEPCIILIDLYLPAHDGIAVLKAIRQVPALEHIQVMVLTSLASPDQQEEIARMGAHYRKKPFKLSELSELANEIAELCKGHAEAMGRV